MVCPRPGARPRFGRWGCDDVVARGHLSAGFIGVGHLLPALSSEGHTDVAYQLLNTDTFPSWLYSVNKGSTTIWERWNGIQPSGEFETPIMNSFNHYSFGAVGEWLYATVAGIQPDPIVPAYRRFTLRPTPGGGLTFARATLATPYGTIGSDWRLENGTFRLIATIPVGTRAQVFPPSSEDVTLDGAAVTLDAQGSFELGSGRYTITSKL